MAKQIYSGLQQSLLERKAGRKRGERGRGRKKNKRIVSRGVDMAPKKKVPSGNVWKKSKGTSFWSGGGCCLAAGLALSHTHSSPVPSGPLLLIEAWFGVPAPADPMCAPSGYPSHWSRRCVRANVCLCVIETPHTQIR